MRMWRSTSMMESRMLMMKMNGNVVSRWSEVVAKQKRDDDVKERIVREHQ